MLEKRRPSVISAGGGGTFNRIGYIDALKGFTTICVVMGHVANGYLSAGLYPESRTFLYRVYNIIYAFHMALFIMISGFVFCTAYVRDRLPDSKRIFRQALNHVAVYFIFSIPFGLLKVIVSGFTNKPVTLIDVAMICVKPIAQYWYLYVLISLYFIFSFRKLYKLKINVMIFMLLVLSLTSQLFSFPYFCMDKLLYYAFFFYIGILRKQQNNNGNMKDKVLTMALFCVSVILSIILWDKENNMNKTLNSFFAASIVIALGISFALWYLFENARFLGENCVLQTIGRYSLEIYLIHVVFTAGFRTVFSRLGMDSVYVSFILNATVSTALPVYLSIICKKWNIHGLFFKPVTYISKLKRGD